MHNSTALCCINSTALWTEFCLAAVRHSMHVDMLSDRPQVDAACLAGIRNA